jgi:ParB family transcriptional regulator, chromosome partitioning protein
MTQQKRGLGRGLDALLSGSPPPPPPAVEPKAVPEPAPPPEPEPPAVEAEVPAPAPAETPVPEPTPADAGTPVIGSASSIGGVTVDIDLITPNPEQPRTNFQPEQLRELADSIREHGVIQPLVVSRDDEGSFQLIAGERRLQAARLAGLRHVPVVVREVADSEMLEIALVENVQRADLNAVEEALAYKRLIDEYGLTQEDVAQRVGKSRVTVSNSLRLLQLEAEVRRSIVAEEISEGHARALLGLPEGPSRISALRDVIKRRLSVRETEAYVRRSLASTPATASSRGATTARRDSSIADIESQLRHALSTRVAIKPQRQGGARITIDCFSGEEFESVVRRILGGNL